MVPGRSPARRSVDPSQCPWRRRLLDQHWAVTFIPMPMPKIVGRTNVNNKIAQLEVCITSSGSGRGMGMSITAQALRTVRKETTASDGTPRDEATPLSFLPLPLFSFVGGFASLGPLAEELYKAAKSACPMNNNKRETRPRLSYRALSRAPSRRSRNWYRGASQHFASCFLSSHLVGSTCSDCYYYYTVILLLVMLFMMILLLVVLLI